MLHSRVVVEERGEILVVRIHRLDIWWGGLGHLVGRSGNYLMGRSGKYLMGISGKYLVGRSGNYLVVRSGKFLVGRSRN